MPFLITVTGYRITRNKESLSELQARIHRVRDPNAPIHIVTLNALKSKKARSTLQDERYRLKVTVANASLQKVNAYLGCSNCGKHSDYPAGECFKCETCTKEGVVSEPRITFNCEVSDGTEQLEITSFTDDTVKLFRMLAPDIFHMRHSGDHLAFESTQALLQDEPFTIEVSPTTTLTRNNILKWALRSVIPETVEPAVVAPLT
ncbi:uncharacterized protein LOC141632370 [Silene latifolia]|uniref:uncharacterized protein LOC141632370 n=1 Tax=Silene latifolia TaxID=37657 RepID=UPI003D779D2B